MNAHQILNDRLGAAFAQRAILGRVAGGVRKADHFNEPSVRVSLGLLSLGPGGCFIDRLLGIGIDDGAVHLEENWNGPNRFIIVKPIDAIVGQRGILESLVSSSLRPIGSSSSIVG